MDCEQCNRHLLDLVTQDDAADAAIKEAQHHAAECASCSAALGRLRAGAQWARQMPVLEPPASLAPSIAAAAARHAEEAPARGGLRAAWAAFTRRVGTVALNPQLATATLMLLVVALGLWYVPKWEEVAPEEGEQLIASVPETAEGDKKGTEALEPAPALQFDFDPNTGRLRTPAGDSEATTDGPEMAAAPDSDSKRSGEQASPPRAPKLARAPAPQRRLQRRSRPPHRAGRTGSALRSDDALSKVQAFAESKRITSRPSGLAAAPQASTGATTALRSGIDAYKSRDFDEAVAHLRRATAAPSPRPVAFLYLGHAYRGKQTCALAVGAYERFLEAHRAHPRSPEAMVAAAECYRRLNRIDQARKWLVAATKHEATASTARKRLRALERPPSSEPASVEAEAAADEAAQ